MWIDIVVPLTHVGAVGHQNGHSVHRRIGVDCLLNGIKRVKPGAVFERIATNRIPRPEVARRVIVHANRVEPVIRLGAQRDFFGIGETVIVAVRCERIFYNDRIVSIVNFP